MRIVRHFISVTLVLAAATFAAAWLAVEGRAQSPEKTPLAGAWTINRDLSDQPSDRSERPSGGDSSGRRGGFGRGGGMRRGGYGGGMGRGNGGPSGDPQQTARMRDAMRDILSPPDHLTITQTESMVVVTGPDGRSTRLSPDGKKVTDDNTKIDRKTHWDGGNLVSEINGVGRGKMTQTFAVDPEHHQLRISVQMDGGRSNQPRTITHVYDSDAQ